MALRSKLNKMNKLNNKGSALVVVIVVVSFICILGTLLLYLSVMNYQMKATDYNTRVSFYGAEEPLEELRMQLAEDVSEASIAAYKQVIMHYSGLSNEAMREAEFQKAFFEQFEAIWNDRGIDPVTGISNWRLSIANALNNNPAYHVIDGSATTVKCANAACTCPYHVILVSLAEVEGTPADRLEVTAGAGSVISINLYGVKVTYTENRFSSVISTNYSIEVPACDWSLEATVYDSLGVERNYKNEWVDGTSSTSREEVYFQRCVNYLNYVKE